MKKNYKNFKKMLTVVALLFLSYNLVAQIVSYDAIYYVSNSGNDATGDGSELNPWATLGMTANIINYSGQGGNFLVFVMSDLTSTACARYYDNSVTIMSLGNTPYRVSRGAGFAIQPEFVGSVSRWYNPAMLEIGGDITPAGHKISLTLENIIFDDKFLHEGTVFNYRTSTNTNTYVQDAIVASYSPNATIVLGKGTELWNYGGMTAVCAFDGATLIMESGSLITENSTAATRQLSATLTDYRAVSESAVSIATNGHFYMYKGAKITNIANAHSVKLSGSYKCLIDGEISGMKGNRGWDATDRSTSATHEGRGFKSAVYFSGGTTLDPITGIPGSAIVGENANIHHNAIKCGALGVNRSTNISVKIYGKINDNIGQAGTSWQSLGGYNVAVPFGTNGGGIYIVAGGTVLLEEGSEVCRNSVMSMAYGGGINAQQSGSKLIMNGGTVQGNTAGGMGPGIAINKSGDCFFEMNGGIVDNGNDGVLLFDNRAIIVSVVREDNDCNGRLILKNGAVSGVTVNSRVRFGNNTANQYRNLFITDKIDIKTGYVAVGGKMQSATSTVNLPWQVIFLPEGSFGNLNIGNPNPVALNDIRTNKLPQGWNIPTDNGNVIGFWMKKEGKMEFSVPKPTTGAGGANYNVSIEKYFVVVQSTLANGNVDNSKPVKYYPTTIVGNRIVVSVPPDVYPNGATVALIQPSQDYGIIHIDCPQILYYDNNAEKYTIPYDASYEMPDNLHSILLTDGYNNSNTTINLYIYPEINTIPDLSTFTLNSTLFELNGSPSWDAINSEIVVPLQFKVGWDTPLDVETTFSFSCVLDSSNFVLGSLLTLTAQLVIVGQATFLIYSNEAETRLENRCPATVTDIEGNVYKVTDLVGLCWTSNMRSTVYNDDNAAISFAKPYYCPEYPDVVANDSIFGLLYTWYSAVRVETGLAPSPAQGICPNGWRLPTIEELSRLEVYPADELKSTSYWLNPGTDDYGFDIRPAGRYSGAIDKFVDLYGFTGFWAADSEANQYVHYFSISYYCNVPKEFKILKSDGLSVRCVKIE